jgi:hypothetical protein
MQLPPGILEHIISFIPAKQHMLLGPINSEFFAKTHDPASFNKPITIDVSVNGLQRKRNLAYIRHIRKLPLKYVRLVLDGDLTDLGAFRDLPVREIHIDTRFAISNFYMANLGLFQLRHISLPGASINDEKLAIFLHVSEGGTIDTAHTDAPIDPETTRKLLEYVDISDTYITDKITPHLSTHPITTLNISECNITDLSMFKTNRFKSLNTSGCTIPLDELDLRALQTLRTAGSTINLAGIDSPYMRTLDVRNCNLNDDDLATIAEKFPILTELDASLNSITDRGLAHLLKLNYLTVLRINFCRKTTEKARSAFVHKGVTVVMHI